MSEETSAEQPENGGEQGDAAVAVPLDTLESEQGALLYENGNFDVILDIPVSISVEIGRTKMNIRHLLKLNQGSVVELDRMVDEPLDVLVNGTLIARGEVVILNDKFGIRLTDVISAAERIEKLK